VQPSALRSALVRVGRRESFAITLFATGLLVRLVYIAEIADSPLWALPPVDAATYSDIAGRLAAGDWLLAGDGPYWQAPLYPYLLGILRALLGDGMFTAARLLQAVLGAATCSLTYLIGRHTIGDTPARVAGFVATIYGPLMFFDGELLPATLATTLNLAGLLVLQRALRTDESRLLAGAGALFGLAAVTVSTTLLFVVGVGAWLAIQGLRAGRVLARSLRPTLVLATAAIVVIAPVTVRNLVIGQDAVLISHNWGINYWLGNNPDSERTIAARPGWEWDDIISMPMRAGVEGASLRARWFVARAATFATRDPTAFLQLQVDKVLDLLAGEEVGRNQDLYFWRGQSWLLWVLIWKTSWFAFPFGLIGPFAVLGLALHLKRDGLTTVSLYVLCYAAGVAAFFVTSRYRIPLIPVLLLLAASGGGRLWAQWGTRSYRRLLPGIIALVGLIVLSNTGIQPEQTGFAAVHYHVGNAYARQGHNDLARTQFERSVRLDPEFWQAWNNLASVQAMGGDMESAASLFARVAAQRPGQVQVWYNLAHAHLALGDMPAATDAYRQAIDAGPDFRRAYGELISLYARQRDWPAAQQVLDAAVAAFPREEANLRRLFERLRRVITVDN
jgi:4-amino-4-deoxy-L-arabinose transferase-like glycosyltransferase